MDAATALTRHHARKSTPSMSAFPQGHSNNASADALGDNWKSALCVTSLYDSYVSVQHENESLREQLRQLQHEKELLQVELRYASKANRLETDDGGDESALVKEVRLLRTEKSQQELLFDKRRAQLESQLAEFKALYQEQLEKYQQRFDLDPNEPKRVAISTVTLHNTLDQVVYEKEELAMQHAKLQQMYHTLEKQSQHTVQELRDRVAELEGKLIAQATHRVRAVLEKWVFAKIAHSWKQWRLVVLSDRLLTNQRQEQQAQRVLTASKRQQYTQDQAAKFVVKLLQSSTRRCFTQWKAMAQVQRERRRRVDLFQDQCRARLYKRVWAVWRQHNQNSSSIRTAVEKLSGLLHRHSRARAWRKWAAYPLRTGLASSQLHNEELRTQVTCLSSQLNHVQAEFDAMYAAHASLVEQIEQSTVDHGQQVQVHTQYREATHNRVADVVAQRLTRLLCRRILHAWRAWVSKCLVHRRKIKRIRHKHDACVVLRLFSAWYHITHKSRQLQQVTRHVMQRMRLLGAYRCFLAWREFAATKKERVETLQRVVRYMKNQQVIKCFKTWVDYRLSIQTQRRRLAAMCSVLARYQTASVFSHWKRAMVVLSKEAEQLRRQQIEVEWQQRLEQSKQELKQLRVSFYKWQTTIASGKKYRHLTRKYAIKWKNGALVKCFEEWKVFKVRCVAQREQLRRLVSRRAVRDLQSGYVRWRTQAQAKMKQLALAEVERERDALVQRLEQELTQLKLEEAASRARCAERELVLQSDLQRSERELQQSQATCQQYKQAFNAVCWSVHQRRSMTRYLRAWFRATREASLRRQIVHRMATQRLKTLQRIYFAAWNALRVQRVTMVAVATRLLSHWRTHLSASCFRAWWRYSSTRHQVKMMAQEAALRAQQRLCGVVFDAWRGDARANGLLRRTLERIWLTSVYARMQHYLSQWTEYTQAARLHEQLRRKEQAIAAIQVKICGRWTAKTQKTVFTAWREAVFSAKRAKRGAARLTHMGTTLWVRFTLDCWKEHHESVKQQRVWLTAWQRKQDHEATEDAWREWKLWTVTKRNHELESLQELKQAQQAALQRSADEICELVAKIEALVREVETLSRQHDAVSDTAAVSAKQVITARHFHRWRQFIVAQTRLKRRLQLFARRHAATAKRRAWRAWMDWVSHKTQLVHAADDAQRRVQHRNVRFIIRAWAAFSSRSVCVKKQINRRHEKQARHLLRASFGSWIQFVQHSKGTQRLVTALSRCAGRVSVINSFGVWKQITQHQRQLSAREAERQKRILSFMMGKHQFAIAKYFDAWKAYGIRRRTRLKRVEELAERNRLRFLRGSWIRFTNGVAMASIQAVKAESLLRMYEKYRLRISMQRWQRQVSKMQEEMLQQEAAVLTVDNEKMHRELAQHTSRIVELTTTVSDLEVSKEALQSAMNQTLAATQTSSSSRIHEATQRLALMKVLLQRAWVSLDGYDLAAAFNKWKLDSAIASHRLWTLRHCVIAMARRRVASALATWRRRALMDAKVAKWTKNRQLIVYRSVWSEWVGFVQDRRVRRQRLVVRWIDSTLTARSQAALDNQVATLFQLWKARSILATTLAKLDDAVSSRNRDQHELTLHRRKTLLTKWMWRAYHMRTGDMRFALTQWRVTIRLRDLEFTSVPVGRPSKAKLVSWQQNRYDSVGATPVDDAAVVQLAQDLQLLFRSIASVQSLLDLGEVISSTLSQITRGQASAALLLIDPTRNELWTRQRGSQQVVKASVSLGIAGATLASCSTPCVVENAARDPRFHPLVDQYAVAGVTHVAEGGITLFSSTIVASDGSVYGVLQIAFAVPTTAAYVPGHLPLPTQVQLLGRACCFFVEQVLHDMVRHCRDPVRARAPDSFAKLFKQNKNWRKYFVLVEKEAQKTHNQLQDLLSEQDLLLQEKERLQVAMKHLQEEREALVIEQKTASSQAQHHELLLKHLAAYKKKAAKLKETLVETEKRLDTKVNECGQVNQELEQLRRDARSKQLQAMITAATEAVAPSKQKQERQSEDEDEDDLLQYQDSKTQKIQLLRGAEVATLKNELVRAESDSLFLVKAVDMATRHHGELPESLKMEVNRIALRVKKPRD